MNELQKRTAEAIVNIFETGRARGDYGRVTLLAGDTGQLTYGRSQTTLTSGNLYLLIKAYCGGADGALRAELASYLAPLERHDPALNHDETFRGLLERAGQDPVMCACQDAFFDRVYWQPASVSAAAIGISTALGGATVYDSTIHGSWALMRDRTLSQVGHPRDVGEQGWIERYIETRRNWLATHSNALLHRTVYRMDALRTLSSAGKWDLPLPLTVRGVSLTEEILMAPPPVRVSAEVGEVRLLRLRSPFMQGGDVLALQTALVGAGIAVETDGLYGPATETAVRRFQSQRGLVADGIAGPATLAALAS